MAVGDDDEHGEVECVRALTEDRALRAALAAGGHERAHVHEPVAVHHRRERLHGGERNAVAGEDVPDLALRDGHERHDLHPVHERRPEVHAAAQDVGLEAGLAVQGDDRVLQRAPGRPPFLDDPDLVVADHPYPDDLEQQPEDEDRDDDHDRDEPEPNKTGHVRGPPSKDVLGSQCWKPDYSASRTFATTDLRSAGMKGLTT